MLYILKLCVFYENTKLLGSLGINYILIIFLGTPWRELSKDFNVPKTVLLQHEKAQKSGSLLKKEALPRYSL